MTIKLSKSEKVLAGRLKEARKRAGISAVYAAKVLGVRRPAIHEIESGARRVGGEELDALAELYRVSARWLMDRRPDYVRDDRAGLAAQHLAGMSDAELDRLMAAIKIVREHRSQLLRMPSWART